MKKIFSIFAAVLFAGSTMVGAPTVTLDFTDAGWNFPTDYVTTAADYTNGDYTITVGAHNDKGHKAIKDGDNVKALLFGKKDATITLPEMTFDVATIVVKGVAGASGKVTFNIFVGTDAVSTQVTSSLVDQEFKIAAGKQAAGTVYVIKVTNANNCQISAVEFYEAVAGKPEKPTFSVEGGSFISAQTVELDCATDGADIFYTLDGTDPTATSTKYTAALNIAATTTVKAIAIKNEIPSDIASATYTIIETTGAGTKENPFTVADVYKLNNGYAQKKAWVIGYIVGCAANEGKVADEAAASNIALGATANQTEDIVPVQLPSGEIREALNIVDNSGNVGKKVKVYGTLEAYFLTKGVKNVEDYAFVSDDPTAIDNATVNSNVQKMIINGQLFIIRDGVMFNANGAVVK